jgi:hypothetical protein
VARQKRYIEDRGRDWMWLHGKEQYNVFGGRFEVAGNVLLCRKKAEEIDYLRGKRIREDRRKVANTLDDNL